MTKQLTGRAFARALSVTFVVFTAEAEQRDALRVRSSALAEEFSQYRNAFVATEALGGLASYVCPKALELGREFWKAGAKVYQEAVARTGDSPQEHNFALRALLRSSSSCRVDAETVGKLPGSTGASDWTRAAAEMMRSEPERSLEYLSRAAQAAASSQDQQILTLTAERLRAIRPDLANEFALRQLSSLQSRIDTTNIEDWTAVASQIYGPEDGRGIQNIAVGGAPTVRLARLRPGVDAAVTNAFAAGLARFSELAEASADPRLLYAITSQVLQASNEMDYGVRMRLSALVDRLTARLPQDVSRDFPGQEPYDLDAAVQKALDPEAQRDKADLIALAGSAYASGRADLLEKIIRKIDSSSKRQELNELARFLKIRRALEERKSGMAAEEASRSANDLFRSLAYLVPCNDHNRRRGETFDHPSCRHLSVNSAGCSSGAVPGCRFANRERSES